MRNTFRFVPLLAMLGAVAAEAGPATTFKIATLAPEGSAWMTEFRAAAVELDKRTGGRVAFKFYPGGVMGNDQSVLRKIRIGQLHGAALTGGGLAEVYADSRLYSLPLAFRDAGEVDAVRAKLDPVLNKGLEDAGFVNFGFADGGFAILMSADPVRTVADLKRQKTWVPEGDHVSYAMMEALGVSPVTLPLTDVMTGLSTGLVGSIFASPLGAVAFQWHTRVKYATDLPFAWLFGVFCIDKRSFDKLAPADQAAMREVFGNTFERLNAQNRADDARAREALAKQGIQTVRMPPDEIARLERAAAEVNLKLAQGGLYDAKLYAEAMDLLRRHRAGGAAR